ncbi:Clavaminate synthase-like protein [Paxillus ammoniavirescens]|nr:Clavaminate synthase-like protein [Paxillus ammoniavirescens]
MQPDAAYPNPNKDHWLRNELSGAILPPFPDDVPAHPLLIIHYELIKAGDPVEIGRLWEAATTIGFGHLTNHGADQEVNAMFDMGAETVGLPLEEKLKFEQGDLGQSCGYKKAGSNAVDANGTLDAAEFITISKDDALAFPRVINVTYPPPTAAAIPTAVAPFVRKGLDVNYTVLLIFNEKLGLPEGTLDRLHDPEEHSGSEARVVRTPPIPGKDAANKATLGSHTDFGSLSFLHNRLGGLQVLPPGHTEWSYRTMSYSPFLVTLSAISGMPSLFSGGILRSNIHRVVPPPGIQAHYERFSVVFFSRPGNSKALRALVEDSPIIAEAVRNQPEKNFETGATAAEWFARRVKYQRINNRKGPDTWAASRDTEHQPAIA